MLCSRYREHRSIKPERAYVSGYLRRVQLDSSDLHQRCYNKSRRTALSVQMNEYGWMDDAKMMDGQTWRLRRVTEAGLVEKKCSSVNLRALRSSLCNLLTCLAIALMSPCCLSFFRSARAARSSRDKQESLAFLFVHPPSQLVCLFDLDFGLDWWTAKVNLTPTQDISCIKARKKPQRWRPYQRSPALRELLAGLAASRKARTPNLFRWACII